MKDLEKQHVCMKFCLKLAKTFTETFQMLKQAYGWRQNEERSLRWRNKTWMLHHNNTPEE
jgi:hypothetical protein